MYELFDDDEDMDMMLAGYPPEVRDYEAALLSDDEDYPDADYRGYDDCDEADDAGPADEDAAAES